MALEEEGLWPLLPLIEVACSDDETDAEEGQVLTPGKGPICVCRLRWRSAELERIFRRLDERRLLQGKSLPGNSSSPQRGRPARPRIRRDNAPHSRIEAPDGLSKDFYALDFLESIWGKGEAMWRMNLQPILSTMNQVLDSL